MRTAPPDRSIADPTVPTSGPVKPNGPSSTHESRRSFVFFGALAVASLVPGTARAQSRPTRPRKALPPATDESGAILPNETAPAPGEWTDPVTRLVRRVTYGATQGEVVLAHSMGYQGYLSYQLNHTRIDDSAVESYVAAGWPQLAQTGAQLYTQTENIFLPLQQAAIYRAAFSRRQLYQRMVEFWTDHFNIDINKVTYAKLIDDRDVIRANALSTFGTLLKASAHSPAMLAYLDQSTSTVGAPNQNYAREVLELHTVGVDNGYTQNDVAELSRVLTGWTYRARGGGFSFNLRRSMTSAQKTVMGLTIPATSPSIGAAAVSEGETVLDMLIAHPNTATFIATKMLQWLLSTTPTADQISTIASVYKATKGDIKSMVRAILNDQWLPASPGKFKRPFHFLVSAVRSTTPTITAAGMVNVNTQLTNLGQPPFFWETLDGYPDTAEYWAGNILPRWSFANTLGINGVSGLTIDTGPYTTGTAAAGIDLIDQNYFGSEMPLSTRTALTTYLAGVPFPNVARVRDTIGLALSAAAFQWY